MVEDRMRILVVEARFYDDIADELLAGATDALRAFGADVETVTVPGALEIPGAIAIAEEAGRGAAGIPYDGYVALGCVIRGETYHFEIVANESARGLMDLAIGRRIAVGNGILTVEDEEQALNRARPGAGDKGGAAARACLDMIALKRRFQGGRP
jgi:6,7-dimethyl-8-ribityllumazine synthase